MTTIILYSHSNSYVKFASAYYKSADHMFLGIKLYIFTVQFGTMKVLSTLKATWQRAYLITDLPTFIMTVLLPQLYLWRSTTYFFVVLSFMANILLSKFYSKVSCQQPIMRKYSSLLIYDYSSDPLIITHLYYLVVSESFIALSIVLIFHLIDSYIHARPCLYLFPYMAIH